MMARGPNRGSTQPIRPNSTAGTVKTTFCPSSSASTPQWRCCSTPSSRMISLTMQARKLATGISLCRPSANRSWRTISVPRIWYRNACAGSADSAAAAFSLAVVVPFPPGSGHLLLQVPPQADELARAIQASLDLLRAAPDRVSFPLLAAVYRAALGGVSFSVFLSGPSGVFKSALAALCQQHFGAAMEASRLPANFASTGNALELLAFSAKDALLVVDDFAPQGGTGDGELHNVADRLFRGAGNQQGRLRLGGNGRLRAAQAPRGLVLGTGEEVPQGQSIRARLVILELGAGEVDRGWLSRCQQAGRDGRLAASMGGFVRWVAGQYEGLQRRLHQRVVQIRSQSCGDWGHARTPAAMAELQGGWEIFLQFAMEVGALSRAEKEQLQRRGEGALGDLAQR